MLSSSSTQETVVITTIPLLLTNSHKSFDNVKSAAEDAYDQASYNEEKPTTTTTTTTTATTTTENDHDSKREESKDAAEKRKKKKKKKKKKKIWRIEKRTERELIITASSFIRSYDPDIITGFEVASNDLDILFSAAEKYAVSSEIRAISRVAGVLTKVRKFQTYGGLYKENINWKRILFRKQKILVNDRSNGGSNSGGGGVGGARLEVGPLVLDCVNDFTVIDLSSSALHTTGLHLDPVVVLDFSSMYPSIMIAHNICFSTLIGGDCKRRQPGGEYEAPVKFLMNIGKTGKEGGIFQELKYFLLLSIIYLKICSNPQAASRGAKRYRFASKPVGVLPVILRQLLNARGAVKKQLKNAKSPAEKLIFDARQKALKLSLTPIYLVDSVKILCITLVCANAVYGFTGTNASKVFVPALAETVLMTGVSQLLKAAMTANTVGHQVIYGDTDSIMIKCLGQTIEEAKATGKRLSTKISSLFPEYIYQLTVGDKKQPCSLKLESIFLPFLLQHNKHYAGAESAELTIKGMEAVSRGTLPVLRTLYNEILENILLAKGKKQTPLDQCTLLEKQKAIKAAVEKSITRVLQIGTNILKGRIDTAELVLSRALWMDDTDNSKDNSPGKAMGQYTVSQPHVYVANKRRKRGERIRKGERISYVLVHPKSGSSKQWEMAEDPKYAFEHQLPLNFRHYVDNLLIGPLKRLFQLPGLLGKPISRTMQPLVHDFNEKERQKSSNRKASEQAFIPLKHIGEKINFSPSRRGIGRFLRPKPRRK
eukprot:jgi/Bigna1/136614/aug1.35_g11322